MAFLQKKPQITSSAPLYTLGTHKTLLIIGLGNPGKKYDGTRHNVGFAAIDYFASKNSFPNWISKKDLRCELTVSNLSENRVILIKPSTFMNASGESLQSVMHFYRLRSKDVLAVYDELAIPFGQLRTRTGGSDGGHNGVKSLITCVGEEFNRLRIGINSGATPKAEASDFVLSRFSKNEQAVLDQIIKESAAIMTEFIFSGDGLAAETRKVI